MITQPLLEKFKRSVLGQVIMIAVPTVVATAGVVIWHYQILVDQRDFHIERLEKNIEKFEQLLQQGQNQISRLVKDIDELNQRLAKTKNVQLEPKSRQRDIEEQDISGNVKKPEVLPVYVKVNLDRSGANIFIDNKLVGTAPGWIEVTSGKHQLQLVYAEMSYGYKWIYVDSIYVPSRNVFLIHSDAFQRAKTGE